MLFRKVKYDGREVLLEWTHEKRTGTDLTKEPDLHETTLRSFDEPLPELPASFDAFRPALGALLEVDQEWVDAGVFKVTGFSINREKDGRMGFVATCLRTLKEANSPLVVNTPHLREPIDSDEYGLPGFMTEEHLNLLSRVQAEAARYVRGERAQAELKLVGT